MRYLAEQRLKRQSEFRSLREQGRRYDCGIFTMWWRMRTPETGASNTPSGIVRVGVVASIASVGNAVCRNKAKRRLREIFRRNQLIVPPGMDMLLIARASLLKVTHAEAEKRFADAWRRIAPPAPAPQQPAP
jgi:ribonuclease P protein component